MKAGEDIGTDHHDDPHWPHCFWYLRQAIHCYADDTIEMPHIWDSEIFPNGTAATKRVSNIDGVGDLRVCRDYDKLYDLRASHGQAVEVERIDYLRKKLYGSSEQL